MGIVEEKVKKYLAEIKRKNGEINAVLSVNDNAIQDARAVDSKKGRKGRLYGYVFGIKSNINVKGLVANCASKTLENYKSTYDATVIEKIKKEDGVIIGMLNCDEFACGSSGETSAFGVCQNPSVMGKIPGGSSSGSAAAVAAGFCDVALGSDTGGSIRNPASHCGVVGVKPSYGLVSRYGLIDLAMSLDQIGPIAKTIEDAALILDVIRGRDEKDTISFDSEPIKLKDVKGLKVGLLRIGGVDSRIQKIVEEKVKGFDVSEVKIEHIDLAVETYYPLVYVEFFSATRRFDGRKYGRKIEENCGEEVLRRILGGSEISKAEFRGQYYQKALKVKELIREEFEKAFKKVDCIVCPVTPNLPWDVGKGKKMKPEDIYAEDALTTPASLAGICSVSIPAGNVDGIPVGMQVMCANGEDSKMLSIANKFII